MLVATSEFDPDFRLLKDFERRASIESEALRELAKLTPLNLNEEQKQFAFEALIEKEDKEFSDSPRIPASFGIYEDQVIETRKKLELTLGRMEGFLDPNQLALYRLQLEWELGLSNVFERE